MLISRLMLFNPALDRESSGLQKVAKASAYEGMGKNIELEIKAWLMS